jgi:hypothetical protein
MSQFFSLRRFSLLVWKHWADHKKRYGLSILAFIGLLITWFVFTILIGDDQTMSHEIQKVTYFFALFVAGTLYTSQYFRDFGSRARAINFLLVPASEFEKFLCSLLYTVVLFFVVFTALFYVVDVLMVTLYNSFSGTAAAAEKVTVANVFSVKFFEFNERASIYLLLLFFSVQSAFLLGSVVFRKYPFIKTIISGFVLFFILFFLVYLFHDQIFPDDDPSGVLPVWVGQAAMYLVYATAPLLWIAAYSRLKRKQA